MQANEQTLGSLERRIDMAVAVAEIDKDVEARLKNLARTVKMSGFRPGKVPLKLVAQQYGQQVRSEVIGDAIDRTFGDKVREEKLRVAGRPRIEPKQGEASDKLEFSAVFEIYPEVALGDISAKEIEKPQLTLGDAEFDKTIEVLRKQRQTFEPVQREAADGDRVVLDFVGRKDGEVFQGGTANDFAFVIGAGSMLADFETQVKGLAPGATKSFEMTFPEDYHAEELKGKPVQFDVTLKEVREPRMPEVDAAFAQALGVADGDLDKMRAEVRANLEREVKKRIQAKLKDQVMNALVEANPIDVPKALVESEALQLAENARQEMISRGMDGSKVPVEPAWFSEQAQRRVRLGLVLAELVKTHKLQATPEQIRTRVDEFAQSYEDPSEVVRWYYGDNQRLAQVEALVIEDNVVSWVVANAKSVDKPISFDELMGAAA
jgi:trigger factor